jgi:hypothetical protein
MAKRPSALPQSPVYPPESILTIRALLPLPPAPAEVIPNFLGNLDESFEPVVFLLPFSLSLYLSTIEVFNTLPHIEQ